MSIEKSIHAILQKTYEFSEEIRQLVGSCNMNRITDHTINYLTISALCKAIVDHFRQQNIKASFRILSFEDGIAVVKFTINDEGIIIPIDVSIFDSYEFKFVVGEIMFKLNTLLGD